MPTYEYHCKKCDQINEKLMKMADPAPTVCDFCGEGPLAKMVSQINFAFKGKGWYRNFKTKSKSRNPPIERRARLPARDEEINT